MSLQSPTYEIAKANHRPMKRSAMKRSAMKRRIKSSAIPYGTNSVSRKKGKKKKRLTDGQLKKKVWKEFSIFVRTRRASLFDGFTKCVTCDVRKHWKEMQAGHFLRGRLNSNLFDERGTNEQCYACNVGRDGNVVEYYEWMLVNHGKEVIDELREKNSITHKWIPGELLELLEKYRAINKANPLTQKAAS